MDWFCSQDGNVAGPYATREDAIIAGRGLYAIGSTFTTGFSPVDSAFAFTSDTMMSGIAEHVVMAVPMPAA